MAVTGKKPSEWSAATIAAVQTATGINDKIENVVEDTTPQLGGDLDTQGNVILGGTAVGSTLSLKSTTADGTLTAKALSVLTGNNGATEAVTVLNNGNVGIGNIAPALVLQGPSVAVTPFTIGAGTPAQAASSVAGNNLTLTASNGVAGSSVNSGGAGGNINITAGNSARLGTTSYPNGGSITLTSGTSTGGGFSGDITIQSNYGTVFGSTASCVKMQALPQSDNGYSTPIVSVHGYSGIELYSTNATVNGLPTHSISLKTGNAASSNYNSPISGNVSILTGNGGNNTAVGGTAGNSGAFSVTTGGGGNATGSSGTRTGGNSGNITLDIGAAGTGATANGTVGYVLLAPTRGNVGVGLTVPTAVLHIKAGTASVASAPLKFTSGTLMTVAEAGAIEFLTDGYYGTITTDAVRKQFAFVESSPHLVNKAASANVRNSHDAEATSTAADYTKVKTITLSKGLLGQQRFLFDIKTSNPGVDVAYGKIYRNGVALGTEQSDTTGSYVTKSEDLTQDWLPGDTVELWVKIANASTASVQNFRIAYDDSPTITVTSVNS